MPVFQVPETLGWTESTELRSQRKIDHKMATFYFFLAKSLFFYSQLISSILQERGHKVSISKSSLSLAQTSYCSLLTILISDLFCTTSYRPIHWPSRISNSVIYVLAIFMWSARINLNWAGAWRRGGRGGREKEREGERCFSHSPAWCQSNFSLHFFSYNPNNDLNSGNCRCPPGKKNPLEF